MARLGSLSNATKLNPDGTVPVTNPDGTNISENVETLLATSTDFEGGQVTVGLTEVEITFTGTTKSVLIEADCENSGFIYIGKSGVTTTTAMTKLEPGASLTIELNDTDNAIYAISDVAGQTIRKLALL